jgi:hypothetical protein
VVATGSREWWIGGVDSCRSDSLRGDDGRQLLLPGVLWKRSGWRDSERLRAMVILLILTVNVAAG